MDGLTSEQYVYAGLIVVLLFAIYYWYRKDIMFMLRKKSADGIIVNWMAATEGGKRYYYPLIDFIPEGGQKISFRADERCEGQPMYEPGTKVTILYLAADPEFRKVKYPS